MSTGRWGLVERDMHSLFEGGTLHGASAARLLERFVRCRDDDAVETIVALYGPMALAVCRRVLRDRCDAEDAFQATLAWTRAVTAAAVLGVFIVLGALALSRDVSNAAVGDHRGPAGALRL